MDAEIVRVGTPGPHGDGAFSSGRGGVGNIGSPRETHSGKRADQEHIPPFALRPEEDGNHHVGRGGQGNVVKKDEPGKKFTDGRETRGSGSQGLAGKLKEKLFGKKSKSPEAAEAKVDGNETVKPSAAATETTPTV